MLEVQVRTFAQDSGGNNDRSGVRALPNGSVRQCVLGCQQQADVSRLQRARVAVCIAAVHLELKQTSSCISSEQSAMLRHYEACCLAQKEPMLKCMKPATEQTATDARAWCWLKELMYYLEVGSRLS